jgi:phage terminase large subunit GpA-like protein
VSDWLIAQKRAALGDTSKLKTFTNTTLGETWEEQAEKADGSELAHRAEEYPLRTVPYGGLILVAGIDVQDNRFEAVVWAIGRGEEQWVVDYTVLTANPADERDWDKLDAYLQSRYPHASGQALSIEAAAIDTGGHFTHQTYAFCRNRSARRIYAVKGDNRQGQPVKGRSSSQDINWSGRIIRHGVKLWHVGTDTAKDLIYGRMKVIDDGPGKLHFSRELPPDFYAQLTAESRVLQATSTGEKYRWIKPSGARNEVLDCTVYALFAAQMLDLHRYTDKMWSKLESVVQPPTADMFAQSETPQKTEASAPPPTEAPRKQIAPPARREPQPRFAKDWW